jgi:dipeptidyl aminopeptidase/acylaminoacyl peptidase
LRAELARSASPINYLHASQPPMLVVHGTADRLVLNLQAEVLVEAMEKAVARSIFILPWGRP